MRRMLLNVFAGAVLAAALAAVGVARGAPPRILVQPPAEIAYAGIERSREAVVSQCLGLYLYDWLGRESDLRLVDEPQARILFESLNDPAATRADATNLLLAFEPHVRVDAVVAWRWNGGVVAIRLERPAGTIAREIPWKQAGDAAAALTAVADWLAGELGVGTTTTPLARGLPVLDPRFIEDYFVAERYRAAWFNNDGLERLRLLRDNRSLPAVDPWVAAAVVSAAARASEDPSGAVRSPDGMIVLAMQSLPALLGTAWEPLAIHFCRVNKYSVGTVEQELLRLVRHAGKSDADAHVDELDAAFAGEDRADGLASGPPTPLQDLAGRAELARSPAREAGAVRCLGAFRSKPALAQYPRIARDADPRPRAAVAWALAQYDPSTGVADLERLRADADPRTAFLAAWALSRRGGSPGELARRAAACLRGDPECEEAADVLLREGGATETAGLLPVLNDPRGKRRAVAVAALARSGSLDAAGFEAALHDPDAAVVRAAVGRLPDAVARSHEGLLLARANHPDVTIAEASRGRLAAMVPADPRRKRLMELMMEHPYVRRKLVEELGRDPAAEAVADLETTTSNPDPHTRALAVGRLAERSAARARPHVLRLVADPHRWVRLHAAAVAADLAQPSDTALLRAAASAEQDPATRLYLEDALARAEGRPKPAPCRAVNRVSAERAQLFLFEHNDDCVRSPVEGYFDLTYKPDEPARRAHAAGKVFLVRANRTAKNPAAVCLDPRMRDQFWLGLEAEFGDLAAVDGVVLGEESMYFREGEMWAEGWRLFCREAGIDPGRVAGDLEKLSANERLAWWSWEQRVAIEGFNAMYDWTKLAFGKLRPGFQVCTFMPQQNGPCEFDRDWKFDIAAGYVYEAGNRNRYTQIRRLKTTWPDRPALWLYDGTPQGLHATGLDYRFQPLSSPRIEPTMPAYADAVCCWMAGAHPGCYYARLALDKDNLKKGPEASGVHVRVENIGRPMLRATLDQVFRGIADQYRNQAGAAALRRSGPQLPSRLDVVEPEAAEFDLEEPDPRKDPFEMRVAAEKQRALFGLLIERKLVYDVARLVSGLPLSVPASDGLLVGDETAMAGALRLPQRYDYLDHVNKVVRGNLSRYRFVAVANHDTARLQDDAIREVTAWLKETPGLLYVRGWLPTERDSGQPSVNDLDGRLDAVWPWAADVAQDGRAYRVTGDAAKPLAAGGPGTLVVWRGSGFKGVVVFDRSDLPPAELRSLFDTIRNEYGAGVTFPEPVGMERLELPGIVAAAACGAGPAGGEMVLPGVDLATGVVNPTLRQGRAAVFVATEFRGKYAAAHGGVAVLCDRPLAAVMELSDGLEIDCGGGLVQAVSVTGGVDIRGEGAIPAVDPERLLPWMLESQDPGVAHLPGRPGEAAVAHVRAAGKLSIRAVGPLPVGSPRRDRGS